MGFFRSYFKALIFTVIVSLGVGSMLGYFGNNERLEMAIEVRNDVNDGYISNPVIKTFPRSSVAYSQKVAGKGRNIIELETTWFLFAKAEAKGYKSNWKIVKVEPNKRFTINLEKDGPKVKESDKKEEKKATEIKQTESPVKTGEFIDKLKEN